MTLVVINILLLILASALNDLHAVNADSGFPTEGDSCTTGKDLWEKGRQVSLCTVPTSRLAGGAKKDKVAKTLIVGTILFV